jgi:hypothetical protein
MASISLLINSDFGILKRSFDAITLFWIKWGLCIFGVLIILRLDCPYYCHHAEDNNCTNKLKSSHGLIEEKQVSGKSVDYDHLANHRDERSPFVLESYYSETLCTDIDCCSKS